jgi:hypothetical protein
MLRGESETRKIPVTMRALLQRLNRKRKGVLIVNARGDASNLGEYYALNTNKDLITEKHVKHVKYSCGGTC